MKLRDMEIGKEYIACKNMMNWNWYLRFRFIQNVTRSDAEYEPARIVILGYDRRHLYKHDQDEHPPADFTLCYLEEDQPNRIVVGAHLVQIGENCVDSVFFEASDRDHIFSKKMF